MGGSFARTGIPENVPSTNYNAANQQTTFGDKTLTYDNNGNLTSITDASGTVLYSWNARNQLVGISGPSVNANFVYDGIGRREKKTINGSLTEFLYDGVNPVQETSGATVLANILTGLGIDEFFARTDVPAATTSHFLGDVLKSTVALTDPAGAVQTEFTYEPFGRTSVTGASSTNPFQYTGRENDGTGVYYYRARYYHPALQRFISEDPRGFDAKDLNLYAYVANNPTTFFDPLGEQKEKPLPGECKLLRTAVWFACQTDSRCEPWDPCEAIAFKILKKKFCILAQERLTARCYPDDPSHGDRIEQMRRGIERCIEFLATCKNCAN